MTGLNTSVLQQFWKEENNTGAETTRRMGIDKIIPGIRLIFGPNYWVKLFFLGCQIDAFQFDPCGYSANALLAGGYYWTIHVTPEREFSYASFETNFPLSDYQNLLERVLSIFKPAHFNVVLMANQVWYYFFLRNNALFSCPWPMLVIERDAEVSNFRSFVHETLLKQNTRATTYTTLPMMSTLLQTTANP